MIINAHVDDARATARHLDCLGVTWLAEAGYREPAGTWSGTVLDPDGNYVQRIELTDAYRGYPPEAPTASGRQRAGSRHRRNPPARAGPRAREAVPCRETGPAASRDTPDSLRYQCGSGNFSLFHSTGRTSGEHSQMGRQLPSR